MTNRQLLRLGNAVVAHTLRTRRHRDRERFPLTAGWIQRAARKLGQPVGEHTAYRIQRALEGAGAIERCGSYPQRSLNGLTGFRVTLYRAVQRALGAPQFSVGRSSRMRATTCWAHPLFGDLAAVATVPKRLRRWREPPPRSPAWPPELREARACRREPELGTEGSAARPSPAPSSTPRRTPRARPQVR